jgi:hypothetical protein
MSRYYFYHANWFTNPVGETAPLQGEVHGIWVVEDESTPDTILSAIEAWLYDDWDKQRQTSGAAASGGPATFFITQFNNVQ